MTTNTPAVLDSTTAQVLATQINAASVRLPPFSPNEALTWFRRAETQFRLKGIQKSATKSDHVLEVLPEDVCRRIAPWLDQQPADIPYEELKKQLLDEFSPSQSERARRVFAMPSLPLGDQTAKQVWYEIITLCRLPVTDVDGKYKEIDLKKELWLQTLPDHVRKLLYNTDSTPIADLVKTADALLEAHRQTQRQVASVASAEPPATDDPDDVYAALPRKNDRNAKDQPRRSFQAVLNKSGICTYHEKFGASARKCLNGCKWQPKNASGGRFQ